MTGFCIVGRKFNSLVVLKKTKVKDRGGSYLYLCKCTCGGMKKTTRSHLRTGAIKTCGCRIGYVYRLLGKKFGRLTVKCVSDKTDSSNNRFYVCVCDCGGEAVTTAYRLKNGVTRSCGCYQKEIIGEYAKTQVGENNPWYNPDLTYEERNEKRRPHKASEWRRRVFERDKYTCQMCSQYGGRLNAHHKNSWHWCVEGRYDVDNGATLCRDCHVSFHRIYGSKNNTEEQYESFALSRVVNKNA